MMRKNELTGDSTNVDGNSKLRKGLWSPEEDEKLMNYMLRNGQGCWSDVARNAGLQRCGKSCRLRWINYLRPDLKRGAFSPQEEELIVQILSKTNDLQINIISVKSNIDISRLTSLLFQMEMKGIIRTLAGGMYHLLK